MEWDFFASGQGSIVRESLQFALTPLQIFQVFFCFLEHFFVKIIAFCFLHLSTSYHNYQEVVNGKLSISLSFLEPETPVF